MSHKVTNQTLATQRVRLWLHMLKAVRTVESALRERLRKHFEMTLPRFDVMATLYAVPEGLRMTELSEQLVVSSGNVTGIVEKLVEDGLVERQSMENDRRAHLVKTTDKGRKLMEEATTAHRAWVDELLNEVSEPDVARAISIMLDIRHAPRG
ncbi:HTH-type transcriptional regulator MhqR [Pseudovibrio axinellae]|uniref:HTH-type transcriptional regulator MhqR n=1 Tax=Pseudovibrio axinellae TaxID=989403 RepID=A0A165SYT9_9HYPH|nr:MarR family transcriptional regulator [Pseudovibrio axinellae]KZL05037.1 HTH-type transcriptional regulator MhqR [Pseudovibrio axinellae]SER65579.1 DNA-binding transcriptional regulator, MarR family [Pseudovibrio axinellae]